MSPGRSLCLTKSSACGRLWQFAGVGGDPRDSAGSGAMEEGLSSRGGNQQKQDWELTVAQKKVLLLALRRNGLIRTRVDREKGQEETIAGVSVRNYGGLA